MSRQIKFRVWDGKRLCGWGSAYMSAAMMETSNRDGDGFGFIGDIYMQFTGLLDKNGKEIYEGDIVEMDHHEHGKVKAEVYYYPMSFGIKPLEEDNDSLWELVLGIEDDFNEAGGVNVSTGKMEWVEVIANRYENPELIPND